MTFQVRNEAATRLAEALSKYADTDSRVLAIPRGGVPMGISPHRLHVQPERRALALHSLSRSYLLFVA